MSRVIAGSILGRGEAVLIVTSYANVILIGFVARSSLSEILRKPQPMCDCMSFVQRNMRTLETVMHAKSEEDCSAPSLRCIEITADDLRSRGLDQTQH